MTAEILPRGEAEAFTARVRALLSQYNPRELLWIMNRQEFYDLRGKERDDVLAPMPGARSILTNARTAAHFRSITDENSTAGPSILVLCVYELSNLKDRTVLWTDKYEVEKRVVKGSSIEDHRDSWAANESFIARSNLRPFLCGLFAGPCRIAVSRAHAQDDAAGSSTFTRS